MARNSAVFECASVVKAEMFADALHGRIFAAIERIVTSGGTANVITLSPEFQADPVLKDHPRYLAKLASGVVTVTNLPDYAQSIRDLWVRRELVAKAQGLLDLVSNFDKSADEIIGESVTQLTRLAANGGDTIKTKRDVATSMVEELQKPRKVTSTGITGLDKIMAGGLIAGKCYAIAARKKVGKTALLSSISYNLDRAGVKHLFIEMEMSPEEIIQHDAARHLDINSIEYLKHPSRDLVRRTADFAASLSDTTLYEHSPGASLDDIRRTLGMAVVRYGIKGAFVDYLQLIEGKGKAETEELHHRRCAQFLANFARKQNVWIVVACQLNQEDNTRGGEGIRLAADMVLGIKREVNSQHTWLQMMESRYTPYQDLGDEMTAGLWFHKHGPHFSEEPPPLEP